MGAGHPTVPTLVQCLGDLARTTRQQREKRVYRLGAEELQLSVTVDDIKTLKNPPGKLPEIMGFIKTVG